MSLPTTKQDLIASANENFNVLSLLINSIPKNIQTSNFIFDVDSAGTQEH